MISFDFDCAYEMYNLLLDALKRHRVSTEDIEANFSEKIFGEFKIPLKEVEALLGEFDEMKYRGYFTYRQKYNNSI
jgi:hypothetical protein